MRVLLNALQAGNQSGTGRYVMELARWLPPVSDELELIALWPASVLHPPIGPDTRATFITVQSAGARRLYHDNVSMRSLADEHQVDLVHYPANFGPMFGWTGGRRRIVTVHDLSFFRDPGWYRWNRAAYYRYAATKSIDEAARVIADSYATATDLSAMLKVAEDKMDVIPLGVGEPFRPVGPEAQATVRDLYNLPESFFLYVGTIEPRKNLVRVIEAWSRIAESGPYDLVIAGRDGWKFKPVRDAAKISPHAARIHFPGYIRTEDLPALLSAARVFVWPSLWEGFGLPPLEAMACGTPVISSNRSSIPEALGDAALLVDPLNVDVLASAMRDAACNEGLREQLVRAGLARAATFTWRRTAQQTVAAYLRAI